MFYILNEIEDAIKFKILSASIIKVVLVLINNTCCESLMLTKFTDKMN